MMRFGAAMAEQLPLMVGNKQKHIHVLDEAPGWVGDKNEHAEIGSLGLGATTRLRSGRKYRCYDGDNEEKGPEWENREQFMTYRLQEIREDLQDTRPGVVR